MSDFLQFIDEILDGDPKFNITDNADGTKNIELATEVIQEGTELSKAGMNRLNAVLGYNETSYTQSRIDGWIPLNLSPSIGATNEIHHQNIDTGRITNDYMLTGRIFNDEYGFENNIYAKTSSTNNDIMFYTKKSGSDADTYGFMNCYTLSSGTAGFNSQYNRRVVGTYKFEKPIKAINIRFEAPTKTASSTSVNNFVKFYYQNELIYTFDVTNTSSKIHNFSDYVLIDEVEIDVYNGTNATYSANCFFYGTVQVQATQYSNDLQLNGFNNFVDNQVLDIITPSDLPTTSIYGNTLNGIDIDTLLQPNKYYELLYNESQNKFIAEEVRV